MGQSKVDRFAHDTRATVASALDDMVYVAGGTFRMGSDGHYPEEAPAHSVTVDAFWIDRSPVTNEEFNRFVEPTGYRTFAETLPNPAHYPTAVPHLLRAGSIVFVAPNRPVDRRDHLQWWCYVPGGRSPNRPVRTDASNRQAHDLRTRALNDLDKNAHNERGILSWSKSNEWLTPCSVTLHGNDRHLEAGWIRRCNHLRDRRKRRTESHLGCGWGTT